MIKRVDYNHFHGSHDNQSDSESESGSEGDFPSVADDVWQETIMKDSEDESEADSSEDGEGEEDEEADDEDEDDDDEQAEPISIEANAAYKPVSREEPSKTIRQASDLLSPQNENSGKKGLKGKSLSNKTVQMSSKVENQWASLVEEEEEEREKTRGLENVLIDDNYAVIRVGPEGKILKCRVCPKLVFFKEEAMVDHLKSRGHGKNMKKLADGSLPTFINSDGEVEEDTETHAERAARTLALAQNAEKRPRANGGRQRQKARKKLRLKEEQKKAKQAENSPAHVSPKDKAHGSEVKAVARKAKKVKDAVSHSSPVVPLKKAKPAPAVSKKVKKVKPPASEVIVKKPKKRTV